MSANFALEWQPLLLSSLVKQKELVDRTLIHCTKAFLMREEYIVTLLSWTLDTKHQIQSQSHWQCTQLHKSRLSAETLKTVDLSKGWHWCRSHAVHFYHWHLTFGWRTLCHSFWVGRICCLQTASALHFTHRGLQCITFYTQRLDHNEQPNHRSKNQIEQ